YSDQLKQEHEKFIQRITSSVIQLYRGQAIRVDELNNLRTNEGHLISMNNFLSTSLSRSLALSFLPLVTSTETLQRILFEIKVDTRLDTRPFADISHLSYFQNEEEFWIIKLNPCNNDDQDMKQVFNDIRGCIDEHEKEVNLLTLGSVLHSMGDRDNVKKYCTRLLNELTDDDITTAHCHCRLGEVAATLGEYDEVLDHLNKAVILYKRIQRADDTLDISHCYFWLGRLYSDRKEYKTALEWLDRSLKIKQSQLPAVDFQIAQTLREIGNVYYYQGDDGYD
ncbi:unnamed protein product, partial [Didymodactylos carnosus]